MSNPTITINSDVESRQVTTKNGPKTVYSQRCSIETEAFRIQSEVEVDGPNMGYPNGTKLEWDVVADLQVGQYQRVELARKKTLRPLKAAARAA